MLVIAILASFVSFLDSSVVTVALPAIDEELGGGIATQQWVVDAYLITLSSLILIAGSLSDVYGRLGVLRIGLIGFGITSIACAIAPTAEVLIFARGAQGIAGALLVPSSLAIILSNFDGAAQAKAIGLWTGWTSASTLFGPVLGGVFVDLLSWRLVFWINVLPIALTLVLLARLTQKDQRRAGTRIDWAGAVLGVLGIGLPVFALIEQGRFGWQSPVIWGSLIAGILFFAAFIWRERTARQPMMPLSLFSVRNFAVGNLSTLFVYGALSLGMFVVSLYLQQGLGYPATLAGAALLPATVLLALLSSRFGALSGTRGPRLFMAVGPMIGGVGFLLMITASTGGPYWLTVLPGVLVFGLGLSITVAPLTAAILGAIPSTESGVASAVNNAVSRLAGLITTALVGLIAGGALNDPDSFVRGVIFAAGLLIVGGIISAMGISNKALAQHAAASTSAAAS